jgi:group I intron endonuclease
MGIIYVATNIVNQKCYVGKTVKSLEKRKSEHISNPSTEGFHGALKKYGVENFEWKIIAEASDDELSDLEVHYINELRAYVGFPDCRGYNRTLGGDGASPGKLNPWANEEVIRKLSEARRGKPLKPETKQKISESLRGKIRRKESIQKGIETVAQNRKLGLHKNKKGSNNPLAKEWIVVFPSGEEQKICGLREFCRQHNLNAKLLREVAHGKWKHHKKFRLRELCIVNEQIMTSTSVEA